MRSSKTNSTIPVQDGKCKYMCMTRKTLKNRCESHKEEYLLQNYTTVISCLASYSQPPQRSIGMIKTRISRFSGFAVCGWYGPMDDWVRIPAEPWGLAKMCYSSKWPQRMYFRLPIWLRSLSFWFWGDRETSRGDGNYPLGRTRVKTK